MRAVRRPIRRRLPGGAGEEGGADVGGVSVERYACPVVAHGRARIGVRCGLLDVSERDTDFTVDSQRYDLVFDAVGKCSFWQCRELLKPRGIWTSTDLGPLSQNPLLAFATRFSRRRRVLFPFPRIDREMVEYLKALVESGRFTPVVDRTYPLENIVEACRYVETQQKLGNVLITVAGDSRRAHLGL